MIQEGVSRHFEYDAGDVLRAFYVDAGAGTEPSTFTHYLYDAGGTRIKKITRKQTGNPQVSLYIDGAIDTHYEINTSGSPIEVEQEYHIMDGRARIARRTLYDSSFSGTQTPEYKYNLENHLGSSSVTLEANGSIYSLEEYFPFGETSFGSFHKKRYRYCGKERDEESGLYYYGARYYAAWTCRFINLDPLAGEYPFFTPYQYAGNKPIISIDIDGLEGTNDSYLKYATMGTEEASSTFSQASMAVPPSPSQAGAQPNYSQTPSKPVSSPTISMATSANDGIPAPQPSMEQKLAENPNFVAIRPTIGIDTINHRPIFGDFEGYKPAPRGQATISASIGVWEEDILRANNKELSNLNSLPLSDRIFGKTAQRITQLNNENNELQARIEGRANTSVRLYTPREIAVQQLINVLSLGAGARGTLSTGGSLRFNPRIELYLGPNAGKPTPKNEPLSVGFAEKGKKLSKSQLDTISSYEKLIISHKEKLKAYIENPYKFDNKGFLENAPNETVRENIIQGRIRHLEQEINTFQNNIQKIRNGQ